MSEKKATKTVFVQIIERPARKVLLKRGIKLFPTIGSIRNLDPASDCGVFVFYAEQVHSLYGF